jgi:hypothetical protein
MGNALRSMVREQRVTWKLRSVGSLTVSGLEGLWFGVCHECALSLKDGCALNHLPDFGLRVSASGFRVSGSKFRVPGFGFMVPDSGFRISGSGFREPGR